ncbi:MAG: response regulator transcription factor [Chloroflexales bacterium]|nr:response regulator transcription factor [Chloroflexales bacterium]
MRDSSQHSEILVLATSPIHRTVEEGLARATRRLEVVGDAQALLLQAWKRVPDLVVIEVTAPDSGPAALCRQLRRYFPCAILIVEEGAREDERIAWLDSGADDVLSLSGSAPAELAARGHALTRRLERQRQRNPEAFLLHTLGMQLDVAGRRLVMPDGSRVDLPATLTRLLAILFSYDEQVVPAVVLGQQLFITVPANLQGRLNTLARNLTQRLAHLPPPKLRIECVRGAGYRLALVRHVEPST